MVFTVTKMTLMTARRTAAAPCTQGRNRRRWNEEARVVQGDEREKKSSRRVWLAGTRASGVKKLTFWQKRSLTHGFYGSLSPSTSPPPDRWVQRDGYGESDLRGEVADRDHEHYTERKQQGNLVQTTTCCCEQVDVSGGRALLISSYQGRRYFLAKADQHARLMSRARKMVRALTRPQRLMPPIKLRTRRHPRPGGWLLSSCSRPCRCSPQIPGG